MIKNQNGFTLIELMITIAIIGIIVATAWPEYERHQTKNRRTDGINAIARAAQELQQCHTDEGGYIKTDGTNCSFTPTSKKGYYTIAFDNSGLGITISGSSITPTITVDSFTLKATPQGIQANDTECTSFSINHLGAKDYTGSGNLKRCWSR